jgi:hypothetical protein
MQRTSGTVIACSFIGVAILGQTAYTAYHDRATEGAEDGRRQNVAKAMEEAGKLAKSKSAWATAIRDLSGQMGIYRITMGIEPAIVQTRARVYSHSDVVWNGPKNVTVRGLAIAAPFFLPKAPRTGDFRQFYSWSRDMVLLDDETWGTRPPTFTAIDLPPGELASMFLFEVKP